MYPSIILELQSYLQAEINKIELSTVSKDGRINSITDEASIIACIGNMFRISVPSCTRHWYDVGIYSRSGGLIPINIKVSKGGTDNALDKKAIVYSFTTLGEEQIPSNMSFNVMMEKIGAHMKLERTPEKEYYYLFVDKTDKTVMIRSLCDIEHYVSNPLNWLQIAWKKEKQSGSAKHATEDIHACFERIRCVLAASLLKVCQNSFLLLSADDRSRLMEYV